MTLNRPEPLGSHHLTEFHCGEPALDMWLVRRAQTNQSAGASRTYVLTENGRVAGYYALAAGSVDAGAVPGNFRRNMPDPVPVIVLVRLAVDLSWQGKGVGRALFRDAVLRASAAGEIVGARGLLVHAISDEVRDFYIGLGMTLSLQSPLMLMAKFSDVRQAD
jgi:GNAT superfamily N-acetyltransferase